MVLLLLFFPLLHLFWSNTYLNICQCNSHVIPNMIITDTNWGCHTWRSVMAQHRFCPGITGIAAHSGGHLAESSSLGRSRLCSIWVPGRRDQHRNLSRSLALEGKADPALCAPPPGCTRPALQEPSERTPETQLSQGTATGDPEPLLLIDTGKIQAEN